MATVTDVENAIIASLKAALPYLKTVASISAFLAHDLDAMEDIAPLCPAAFVVYERGDFTSKSSNIVDRGMVVNVLAVVTNLRGEQAVRHGATGHKGIYDVLEDILHALTNNSCGQPIDPLLPKNEQCVVGTQDLSVYSIAFETRARARL